MRLQEEMNDLQSSTEDREEEICHFEKLLSDKSQEVNRRKTANLDPGARWRCDGAGADGSSCGGEAEEKPPGESGHPEEAF